MKVENIIFKIETWNSRDWRNSSAGKMPAVKAEECGFGSPECVARYSSSVCYPNTGVRQRREDICCSLPHQSLQISEFLVPGKRPWLKSKTESSGETYNIDLWPLHAHTYTCTNMYICMYPHDHVHTTHMHIPQHMK